MKTVILNDIQSLSDNINGVTGQIDSEERFQLEGFWYDVHHIINHGQELDLYLVYKCVSEDQFDTYVCYVPPGFEAGDRELHSWLFGDDEAYLSPITQDEIDYQGVHSLPCEVDTELGPKPGFVSEYRAEVETDNPNVFIFETIDERDGDSYIQLLQGYLVPNMEVEVL
jgi:hypothetical protein